MKHILPIGINILVIVICVLVLYFCDIHIMKIDDLNDDLNISTSIGSAFKDDNSINKNSDNKIKNNSLDTVKLSVSKASIIPVVEEKPVYVAPALSNVNTPSLETQYGAMSAYGPDCAGCSGHLGGGFDANGGSYVYTDATYGNVRIVAGDSKYPYGTIIKVSNSKMGEFNAIVLDRGGDIGIGRRFMFDLLFSSEAEAAAFGTSYDCTFDILRYGY